MVYYKMERFLFGTILLTYTTNFNYGWILIPTPRHCYLSTAKLSDKQRQQHSPVSLFMGTLQSGQFYPDNNNNNNNNISNNENNDNSTEIVYYNTNTNNNDNDIGDDDHSTENSSSNSSNKDNNNDKGMNDINDLNSASLYMEQFRRRRGRFELREIQNQWQRPPNPFLGPTEFVSGLLAELRHPRRQRQRQGQRQRQWQQQQYTINDENDTDKNIDSNHHYYQNNNNHNHYYQYCHSGILALLEASTDTWRQTLIRSVGAPSDATNTQVAPTLEAALGRPNNQFALLLGLETTHTTTTTNNNNNNIDIVDNDNDYVMDFPTDPMDYGDGTCWVECRLRSPIHDELLVVTGWSLVQRPTDGAWIVDFLDWQDFREAYRPGIGREEWERICG